MGIFKDAQNRDQAITDLVEVYDFTVRAFIDESFTMAKNLDKPSELIRYIIKVSWAIQNGLGRGLTNKSSLSLETILSFISFMNGLVQPTKLGETNFWDYDEEGINKLIQKGLCRQLTEIIYDTDDYTVKQKETMLKTLKDIASEN